MNTTTIRTIRKRVRYVDEEGFEFRLEPIPDTLTVTKTKAGFEARYLVHDEDADSPDSWGNDDVFLVHYHRDFEVRRDTVITKDEAAALSRGRVVGGLSSPDLRTLYWAFPVAAHIHGGVVLSLGSSFPMDSQGWDTSHVGLALVAKKGWPEEEKARAAAQSLIEEWNMYLNGDVYIIVKETYDAKKTPIDCDSGGGVYGRKYALEALKTDI